MTQSLEESNLAVDILEQAAAMAQENRSDSEEKPVESAHDAAESSGSPDDLTVTPAEPVTQSASQLDELIITTKGDAPQFQTLEKTLLTLGRELINDVPLVSTAVSRHHARIEKRNGQWFVTDLGSTNGSYLAKERLAPNVEYAWQSGHPLQLGPFTLQWQSPRDLTSGQTLILMPNELKALELADAQESDEEQSDYLNAVLDKSDLEIALGDSAEIKLGIISQAKIDKLLELIVAGIPEHWVDLPSGSVTVTPKKHRSVAIKIDVPQSTMVEADTYDYEVILRDMYNKAQVTRLPGKITVPPVHDMSMRMVQGEGEDVAPVKVTVKNLGNVQATYNVKATSADGVRVEGSKWTAKLKPGQSAEFDLRASAETRPLFGKPQDQAFALSVSDEAGTSKQADGKLTVPPALPAWMIVAALVGFTVIVLILTLLLR